MICINVICKTYNYIVFSDFILAVTLTDPLLHSFLSFLCREGCCGGEGFCPMTLAPLKAVCLWAHTHKCEKVPFQLLNSSNGPYLPHDVVNWTSPWNSDDMTRMDFHIQQAAWPRFPHVGSTWPLCCCGFSQLSMDSWKPCSSQVSPRPPPLCPSYVQYSPSEI